MCIVLSGLRQWPGGVDIPKSSECCPAQPLAFVGNRCSLCQEIPLHIGIILYVLTNGERFQQEEHKLRGHRIVL